MTVRTIFPLAAMVAALTSNMPIQASEEKPEPEPYREPRRPWLGYPGPQYVSAPRVIPPNEQERIDAARAKQERKAAKSLAAKAKAGK